MKIDIDALRTHIGRKIEETDEATLPPMRGMTVVFERPEPAPKRGDPVPPGWHWCFFVPLAPRSVLGADGLPTSGGVLPEMPLPRRMFAGQAYTFHAPILVGDELRRETELADLQLREGGTGTMVFATVRRRIYTPRGLAVTEDQHTVFREAADPAAPARAPKRDPAPTDVAWRRTYAPDTVTLFRYSALTLNPHRIHYDRTYAMQEEGYPGLVVHGPFSQQCLLDLLRDNLPGKAIRTFTMRARAPLFDTAPFTVIGRPTAEGAEVWAVGPDGGIAMQASATLG